MAYREGAAPSRVFYGWWVAAAFSLIIFVSTGIRFAVGPFLKPVVDDLGLDRGSFSLVISLFLYGAFMRVIGPLVDRWGSRIVCSLGAVVIAASLVLTGTMTSLWEFALYYGVLAALGLAATGHVVASATIARWFMKRRGPAVSLLSVASMAGISLLVPMVVASIGGLGMADSLAMTSALSADLFGRFSVGLIFGLIFLIHQAGAALGAWLAGLLFDLSGDYGLAFAVSCGLLLLGAGLSMTINVAGRLRARSLLQPVAGGR